MGGEGGPCPIGHERTGVGEGARANSEVGVVDLGCCLHRPPVSVDLHLFLLLFHEASIMEQLRSSF